MTCLLLVPSFRLIVRELLYACLSTLHYLIGVYLQESLCNPDTLLLLAEIYEGRTESHEQLCFACELGTADEECGGRWNQLLCYP